MQISRRGLITGLVSFVAAPAIVRASSLMPVKAFDLGPMTATEVRLRQEQWYKVFSDTAELLIRPPVIGNMSKAEVISMYSRRLDEMAWAGLAPPFGWTPT